MNIHVTVHSETSSIVVNAAELDISKASFTAAGSSEPLSGSIALDGESETASFTFAHALAPGKGVLSLEFTGVLNDRMKGFYRSRYVVDGEQRYAAVTQFEATDARRALPCWDEPAHKARFDVRLTVPRNRVALSNMPVVHTENVSDTLHTLTYDTTPIMSTYLLAFVVGEFDYIEARTPERGVVVRVYTPLGKQEQGRFGLDVAVRTLPFYERWFGIEYPLPKLDLIAIADFAAGAMENWGLITYRETALLVDASSSSAATRQWVALVVGHEIAHQWFGNLVTMEWWTHLWLNEGFASWVEYLCVDACFPDWRIWTQFVFQDMARAYSLDALLSSHAIEVPVGHPSEVDEIFDEISYSKGSTVIRMLHGFLGEEAFRAGLNHYLNKHQFRNTFTEDLWDALELQSGKPVATMMNTWTKQMGYPVLSVTEAQPGRFVVRQNRFLASEVAVGEHATSLWYVPIGVLYAASGDAQTRVSISALSEREGHLDLSHDAAAGGWIKLNPHQTALYRVHYSEPLQQRLKAAISSGALVEPTDRLGIQNDALALARAGITSTNEFLDLLLAYTTETDYTVWCDISANLGTVAHLLSHTDFADRLDAYTKRLYKHAAERLGWDAKPDESHLDAMLRALVIGRLGRSGDDATVAEAKRRFANFVADRNSLTADLRSAVYGVALKYGDESVFEDLRRIARESDLQEEKVRCYRALASTSDPVLLQRALDLTIGDEVHFLLSLSLSLSRSLARPRSMCAHTMATTIDSLARCRLRRDRCGRESSRP